MSRQHTHYDNLRITRNATPAIIKAAYRVMSAEYHPDKNLGRDTTRVMQILNDAYAVLSDPIARKKYDAKLAVDEKAEPDGRQAEQDAERQRHARSEAEYKRRAEEAERRAAEAERQWQASSTARKTAYQSSAKRAAVGLTAEEKREVLAAGLLIAVVILILYVLSIGG